MFIHWLYLWTAHLNVYFFIWEEERETEIERQRNHPVILSPNVNMHSQFRKVQVWIIHKHMKRCPLICLDKYKIKQQWDAISHPLQVTTFMTIVANSSRNYCCMECLPITKCPYLARGNQSTYSSWTTF